MPRGQREQEEAERLAEDRVGALPASRGAYQNSASVGHSSIIAAPVTPAMSERSAERYARKTGSTEKFTGCPAEDNLVIARQIGSMGPLESGETLRRE